MSEASDLIRLFETIEEELFSAGFSQGSAALFSPFNAGAGTG